MMLDVGSSWPGSSERGSHHESEVRGPVMRDLEVRQLNGVAELRRTTRFGRPSSFASLT